MHLFVNEATRESPFFHHELSFHTPLFAQRSARRDQQPSFASSSATMTGADELDRDYLGQIPEVYLFAR